ncbi:conserved hypothetical protein [Frankia canadensis]|uniref:DUF7919 domain-containing protein n=1 Tax=Frankia canadensis TaxID=1836972 RepID=A0A2I2KV05_9ACTN|nr:hypothetical protein [Frankia canadensis]SNQ49499.1 conserved hypothetical protein [Frankia canadensis]SOU56789.1 conserved hypothetical protein [Frankia canadensis]
MTEQRSGRHLVQPATIRGFHNCLLPHATMTAPICIAHRGGEEARLGSAEIGVVGAEIGVVGAGGELLLAPNLVFHYVEGHHYRPPDIFAEAVLARRAVVLPADIPF